MVHVPRRHYREKFLCKRRSYGRGMLLPVFVSVRVRVVTDSSDDNAREVVHQSHCLRFDAETMTTKILAELVSGESVLDDLITRCNKTIVHAHIPGIPLYNLGPIAEWAVFSFL